MRRRGVLVAALTVLAVGVGITTNVVNAHLDPSGPTSVTGRTDEDISVYPYSVHVSDIRVTEAVVDHFRAEPVTYDSDGVWVVIRLAYATHDSVRVPTSSAMVLRDSEGREYPVSLRTFSTPWLAGPDTWVAGDLAFEVALDSHDLTFVFTPRVQDVPLPTPYAQVPLGVGADDVVAEPADLAQYEVMGADER